MKKTIKYLLPGALALAFVAAPVAVPTAFAQDTTAAAAPAANQDEKAALDKKFRDNFKNNRAVAYEAAEEYLKKYSSDADSAEFVKYLQNWVDKYKKGEQSKAIVDRCANAVKAKNDAEVFAGCQAWLATAEPNNFYPLLTPVDYGYALATRATPVNTYNDQTIDLAKQTIARIEQGKVEDVKWTDYNYKDKNDVLGWMNFMIGYIMFANQQGKEAESVPYFYKATQHESTVKTDKRFPIAYYALGFNYRDQYNKGVKEFQEKSAGATELTDELKTLAGTNKALADRAIDAFARAVKIATDTKNANKDAWMKDLTEVYKARNSGQTTGMDTYVAGVMSKPLPDPATPVTPVVEDATTTTSATTSTTTTTTPNSNASTTNPATSDTTNRPRTTTTTNANTSTTTTNSNSNTTTTRPAPNTNNSNSNTTTPKPAPPKRPNQ